MRHLIFQQRLDSAELGVEASSLLIAERGGEEVLSPQRSNLEDVVFFLVGTHRENCGGDDHSEKYQCKNKIVDHWGSFSFSGDYCRL